MFSTHPQFSNHSVARHGGSHLWLQLPGRLNQEEYGFKVEQGEPASKQMLNPTEGACRTPSHTFYFNTDAKPGRRGMPDPASHFLQNVAFGF